MSNKGTLKFVPGQNIHQGNISSYHFHMPIKLEPRNGNFANNEPTHRIIGRAPAGHEFEAGVAWEGTVKNGDQRGKAYFTLKFEDPHEVVYNAWPSRTMAGEFDIKIPTEKTDNASEVNGASQSNNSSDQQPASAAA